MVSKLLVTRNMLFKFVHGIDFYHKDLHISLCSARTFWVLILKMHFMNNLLTIYNSQMKEDMNRTSNTHKIRKRVPK